MEAPLDIKLANPLFQTTAPSPFNLWWNVFGKVLLGLGSLTIGNPLLAQQSNLSCSMSSVPVINSSTPSFTVTQANSASPITASWSNASRLIDNSTSNFATATIALGGSATISVADATNDYAAGNFAGFVVDPGLLSLLNSATIKTYLGGSLQETSTSATLASISLGSGLYEVGIYTNLTYDQVEVTFTGLVGSYDVYYAIMKGTGSCMSPSLNCNANTSLNFPTYAAVVNPANTGLSGVTVGSIVNQNDAADNNAASYAVITTLVGVSGTASLAVKDVTSNYPAGTFAGFDLESGTLLNVSLLNNMVISTYKEGIYQEQQSGSALVLGATVLATAGRQTVGFVTTTSFDEVKITLSQPAGLGVATVTNVYSAVFKKFCGGAPLTCNTYSYMQESTRPVYIDAGKTGVIAAACALCTVNQLGNLLDADSASYGNINLTIGALATGEIAVKDHITNYQPGTFAGFDIENVALLDASVLSNLSISLYRDGVLKQTKSSNNLIASAGSSLLASSGRMILGFVADSSYDEVQLSINQTLSVSFGNTKVFGAVLDTFCQGPALTCNTPVYPRRALYPMLINAQRTGVNGAACVACELKNAGRLIDSDSTNYAEIILTAGALVTGSVSVKEQIADYPAGTFAGYDIENDSFLVNAGLLSNVTITTYRDGVQKQSVGGTDIIVSVTTALLGTGGRMTLGIVADSAFDEVMLSLNQPINVSLGATRVYGPVFEKFCSLPLACSTSYWLNNTTHPVIIDELQTGLSGVACALCAVNNTRNVISSSTTDYGQIITVAGVLSSSSIAVKNVLDTYPAGTVAGFAIREPNNFLQISLFKTITLSTYNNGVLQESRSGGNLLNLAAIIPIITTGTGVYNVGMLTTKPFDEVKISLTPVVGVAPVMNVYGAFVDTRYVDTLSGPVHCRKPPIAEPDHFATSMDSSLSASLRTNDRDPQNSPLTYNTTPVVSAVNGSVTINADGTFTYQPNAAFTGRDSFSYSVCNSYALCATSWAYISVTPPRSTGLNNPPLPATDYSQTIMNKPVSGHAASNDIEPDGNEMTYTISGNPTRGSLSLSSNGAYTYTPDTNFIGNDTAYLQVCDDAAPPLCRTSMLIVTVYPDTNTVTTNHPPFAQNDVIATVAGTPVTSSVRTNDSDPDGDTLTIAVLGTVPASRGTLVMSSNGTYTFTPAPGFDGDVIVAYQACDALACDTATLTIVVQPNLGSVPLPLQLLSFTGRASECMIRLDWFTDNEKELRRFEVEYSLDGKAFHKVGQVDGKGGQRAHYNFLHIASNGTALYRLKMVSNDNAYAYSPTVVVNAECSSEGTVKMTPNPTSGAVSLSGLEPGSIVEIVSMNGTVVQHLIVESNLGLELHLEQEPAGVYQIVVTQSGKREILKLVKQ